MSILTDFDVTVHAQYVENGEDSFSPCVIRVSDVMLKVPLEYNADDKDKAQTRLDLTSHFTEQSYCRLSESYNDSRIRTNLFIRETLEEYQALVEKGEEMHLKKLRDYKLSIF